MAQLENARGVYEKALALDEDNAFAWQGLSTVYRRQGLNQETVDTALRAVSLLHRLPVAHFNLGVALARAGESERARLALQTALRFQPDLINAHRFLAALESEEGGDSAAAAFHRAEVQKFAQSRPLARSTVSDRSEKLFDLPEIPPREKRGEILLRERPDPKGDEERSGKTFILVSGLPRSGTSVMMQMLEAGGITPLTDRERAADIDNPKGYYEWEPIKLIAKKPELLDEDGLAGRALKCISMLLPHLPSQHNYKVIFMTRPIEEVVASQAKMVARLGKKGAELDEEELERGLTAHRNETRSWLRNAPHMEFIEIDYPSLIQDSAAAVAQLVEFLGAERLPRAENMATAVDASLYRRKRVTT